MGLALPVHRIVLLAGAPRLLAAAGAGAVSTLAMPPYGFFPILAITFPILVWLLDGVGTGAAGLRAGAATGFAFGFGYFLVGLWWIGAAFLVDGDRYVWMMPFAVIGLPLFLALFPALGLTIATALWSDGAGRIFALALGLGASEWLRGRLVTGFPWNEIGYALAANPVLGQAASIIGVDGLTLITILIFSAPAVLADGERAVRWRPLVAAIAALALLAGFGAWRLHANQPADMPGLSIRIMQPNVPQDDKFRPARGGEIMARYLALSGSATSPERRGMQDVDLLIWPESAFPFLLARTPSALAQIAALLPENAILLTGAARVEEAEAHRAFNSIYALADDGSVIDTYDKVHLVPFGEYLPFQDTLEGLGIRQLTRLPGGFSAGDEPRNIVLPNGLKLGPLICYEAIFPNGTLDPDERPDVLINLTNDAWFGDTPGPHQHFAQSRVRAIEQGLPMLRAANTGISAIVDPLGRVVSQLPLGTEGVLDSGIPAALPPTIYSLYSLYVVFLLYVATIVGVVGSRSWV